MDLQIINPANYPAWDELLLPREELSFFHTSAWAKTLSESYRYSPLYFALIRENRLDAVLPFMEVNSILTGRKVIALPFSDYCEPVIGAGISFHDVFEHIAAYGRRAGWEYIEIRGGEKFLAGAPHSAYYYGHILDISQGPERIFSNLRDSTRRNIKKAARDGVQAQICHSPESVKEFYRLNCLTRRDHGLPPQPYFFFERVYEHIIKEKLGFIVLASYRGKNIAANMYFHIGDRAVYKYGASDKKYRHLRPNNLVMWEAIKWYSENGFRNFSFGRTEPDAPGQRQFKTGWGADETTLKYYTYDLRKNTFIQRKSHVSGIHNKIFGAMPLPVSKIIGKLLYRHMG